LLSISWARREMARRPLSNSQITDGPTPDRTDKPVLVQPRNFRAALHCSGEIVISATRADRVGVSTGCIPQTSSPLFERAAGIAILLRAGSRLVLRASRRVALQFAAAADDEADRGCKVAQIDERARRPFISAVARFDNPVGNIFRVGIRSRAGGVVLDANPYPQAVRDREAWQEGRRLIDTSREPPPTDRDVLQSVPRRLRH
jgi:hypothetical protein